MKGIIINADDFGLNSSINRAIVESFDKGLINSTTLMANMPGFDEAVELAYNYKITDKIGVHLNLDKAHYLTSEYLNKVLLEKRDNLFFLSGKLKRMIYDEFAAQIEKIKNTGLNITHIDTHHHIHEIWPITKIVFELLKNYNISNMRILNNLNTKTRFYKLFYRYVINKQIKTRDINFTNYFGNQFEAKLFLERKTLLRVDKRLEIMVHPNYNSLGKIVDIINSVEYSMIELHEILKLSDI